MSYKILYDILSICLSVCLSVYLSIYLLMYVCTYVRMPDDFDGRPRHQHLQVASQRMTI